MAGLFASTVVTLLGIIREPWHEVFRRHPAWEQVENTGLDA